MPALPNPIGLYKLTGFTSSCFCDDVKRDVVEWHGAKEPGEDGEPWRLAMSRDYDTRPILLSEWALFFGSISTPRELMISIQVLYSGDLISYMVDNLHVFAKLESLELYCEGDIDIETEWSLPYLEGAIEFLFNGKWPSLHHLRYPAQTMTRAHQIFYWARSIGVESLRIAFSRSDAIIEDLTSMVFPASKPLFALRIDTSSFIGDQVSLMLQSAPDLSTFTLYGPGTFSTDHCRSLVKLDLNHSLEGLADLGDMLEGLAKSAVNLREFTLQLLFNGTYDVTASAIPTRQTAAATLFFRLNILSITYHKVVHEKRIHCQAMEDIISPALVDVFSACANGRATHNVISLELEWVEPATLYIRDWLLAFQGRTQLIDLQLSQRHNRVPEELYRHTLDRNYHRRHSGAQLSVVAAFSRANPYNMFEDCVNALLQPIMKAADVDTSLYAWIYHKPVYYTSLQRSRFVQSFRGAKPKSPSNGTSSLIDVALSNQGLCLLPPPPGLKRKHAC